MQWRGPKRGEKVATLVLKCLVTSVHSTDLKSCHVYWKQAERVIHSCNESQASVPTQSHPKWLLLPVLNPDLLYVLMDHYRRPRARLRALVGFGNIGFPTDY